MLPSAALDTSRRAARCLAAGTSARPVGNPPGCRALVNVVVTGGTFFWSVLGAQPEIRPTGPSPALLTKISLNRNFAGTRPSPLCWLILNDGEPLKTIPVGLEAVTSRGTFPNLTLPLAPAYRVIFVSRSSGFGTQFWPQSDLGLKLLLTHSGVGELLGPNAMPQGFLTSLSRSRARPGMSETRFTCLKAL